MVANPVYFRKTLFTVLLRPLWRSLHKMSTAFTALYCFWVPEAVWGGKNSKKSYNNIGAFWSGATN
jgi:hypothetical protein